MSGEYVVGEAVVVTLPRWRRNDERRRENGTITKIARKYLTIEHGERGTETQFSIQDRVERHGDYTNYLARFDTPQQIAEQDRRERALAVWREHNIEFRLGRQPSLTLDQIEAVAQIIDPTFDMWSRVDEGGAS